MKRRLNKTQAIVAGVVAMILLFIAVGFFVSHRNGAATDQKATEATQVAKEAHDMASKAKPEVILDEPQSYVAMFGGDTVVAPEDAWQQATCSLDKIGPIVTTNGEVLYMPDKFVDLNVTAEFDERGLTDKVVFETPDRAIDYILPINIVNPQASDHAVWAKDVYAPASTVDEVSIVAETIPSPPGPPKYKGFGSEKAWMVCLRT